MPVACPIAPEPLSQEDFGKLEYEMVRFAYEAHNCFGRLCDEEIYQNDLAARIRAACLGSVHREVPLTITHGTFSKSSFLDLVLANSAVYELKTAENIIDEHEAQLLNYLLLWGGAHGKIINF